MNKIVGTALRSPASKLSALIAAQSCNYATNPLVKSAPSLWQNSVDADQDHDVPDIRELRRRLLCHGDVIYSQPRAEFDPTRMHTVAVGLQKSFIPVVSSPAYRHFYFTPDGELRVGMLLEELDTVSTWCGYKHNHDPSVPMCTPGGSHTMGVVTARVDRIDIPPGVMFRQDKDIHTTGFVTWSGGSSMEITINYQQEEPRSNKLRTILVAKFVMVIVSPELKPLRNVPLKLITKEDEQLFQLGEKAKQARTQRDRSSITAGVLPTHEELSLLHDLQLKVTKPGYSLIGTDQLPSGHTWMEEAVYARSFVTPAELTNCHGFIFGGTLLRQAYEAAQENVANFIGHRNFRFVGSTNNFYYQPAEMEATLVSSSQVCFTDGEYVQVYVVQSSKSEEKGIDHKTCTFNFTFKSERAAPQVVPRTFTESMRLLNSRREMKYAMERPV